MPLPVAWTPDLEKPAAAVYSSVLDHSQVTETDWGVVKSTVSVLLSSSMGIRESPRAAAREIMAALGGELSDVDVRKASAHQLARHLTSTEPLSQIRGRFPSGF